MNPLRMFSWDKYKGEPGYLKRQRSYELARTILIFGIAFGIFGAGYALTGTRGNIFTIMAVLMCLPGSKSLVETIMFFRYRGCPEDCSGDFGEAAKELCQSFDRVFTSAKVNYSIAHLAVSEGAIACFTIQKDLKEEAFREHLQVMLQGERLPKMAIKVYTRREAYLERLRSMKPSAEDATSKAVLTLLHQISL